LVRSLRGLVNKKLYGEEKTEEKNKDGIGQEEQEKTINNPVILPWHGHF